MSWERKELLRWNNKHFSSFLKGFLLSKIISGLRVHLYIFFLTFLFFTKIKKNNINLSTAQIYFLCKLCTISNTKFRNTKTFYKNVIVCSINEKICLYGYIDKAIRNIEIKLLLTHKTTVSWCYICKSIHELWTQIRIL